MRIDVFFDVVCPWCYIGKHRLERALAIRPLPGLEIRWQPFQLNPEMPKVGVDRQSYMIAKFGGRERMRQINAVVAEAAAKEGLPLNQSIIRRTPNTVEAHRLIRHAGELGEADRMVDALFSAYFAQGLDVGDRATLISIAVEIGFDRKRVAGVLASELGVAEIQTADLRARQLGIQAVPCFVFDGRYAVSGAQEPSAFLPLLDLSREHAVSAPLSERA
ncbi:putative DsbA family dithiol-disulfide isomerase [Inquilinus ginsengisoli]|uniref:DsbA family dithiol-disulfide isomerase n=1 Tax=Inquilinus ginsengisoli TaxID=363840 RepID=A0ABU1JNQ7_9PROT|nr:DsbA family oxidoreductase [Inquilinus ginsengisoli]MDR6289943.1 putative DsbA family dithiol-disulfide isomerase [Inquilinus ginsengisoli]